MTPIRFESIGGDWVDPPILMPAALPLELSGEAVRSRLITSSDIAGDDIALRPDLTLAVARLHIENGSQGPVSYRYFGKAFRQPVNEGDPLEFYQTGFECFGHEDRIAQDVIALTAIGEAIEEAGLNNTSLRLGNISVFSAVVSALGLSPFWEEQLNRAFRRKEGIRSLLTSQEEMPRSALATTLAELPEDRADALLDEVLAMSGGQVIGGRTREDILRRLQSRAEASREGPLSAEARALLGEVIDLQGTPDEVLSRLNTLTQSGGLDLSDTLDGIASVFSALKAKNLSFMNQAHFSIQFGRRFEYYDGLVFELSHSCLGPKRPVAAGGRYDGLISRLSQGEHATPAIGGVVRPDRIEQALKSDGGKS